MTGDASSPVYRINAVRHRYATRTVLDIPALEIGAGETLGVIGPSGAGKSTLLRLLQFLESPDEGRLWFRGEPITSPPPLALQRTITTVFQRPVMLDRTVRENVLFGLHLRGQRDPAVADQLLERVALAALARRPARTLSGGEMQRVALARAVAVKPDVLLLDEPAANLDPANVAIVEGLVRQEQQRGATIVLVTHNTHEARRLAHRTLLLLDGRPVETAPTETLFATPADPRTRAFLAGELIY
jgi:tungstate transport system ATP-binding protein